jgi:hypothetical protein
MTGYTQSKDRHADRFLTDSGGRLLRAATVAETNGIPLVGHFAELNGERVMLFRCDERLYVRFGHDLPLATDGLLAEWWVAFGKAHFRLKRGEQILVERSYSLSVHIKNLVHDPTPFVEAEDFDFLLFVRNVLNDSARSQRIYRRQGDSP